VREKKVIEVTTGVSDKQLKNGSSKQQAAATTTAM